MIIKLFLFLILIILSLCLFLPPKDSGNKYIYRKMESLGVGETIAWGYNKHEYIIKRIK